MFKLLLLLFGLAGTVLGIQMFCLVPDDGCQTLPVADCTGGGIYLGCKQNPANLKACMEKPQCKSYELKCAWKSLTLEATSKMLPGCLSGGSQALCDSQRARAYAALEIASTCDGASTPPNYSKLSFQSPPANSTAVVEYFVNPESGLDSTDTSGTSRGKPFATLEYAVLRSRTVGTPKKIWLLPGKHRVLNTVELTDKDSLLTIEGEPGAVLSGSQPLGRNLEWKSSEGKEGAFVTALPSRIMRQLGALSTLFVNGMPMVRARYPNVASYGQRNYATVGLSKWRTKTLNALPITNRNAIQITDGRYGKFYSAQGGKYAGQFTPDVGYFNEPTNEAQGGCAYSIPGSVTLGSVLANQLNADKWMGETQSVYLHVFHPYKWGLWTFDVTKQVPGAASAPLPTLNAEMDLENLRAWQDFYTKAGGDNWPVCGGAQGFFNPCSCSSAALQRVSCAVNAKTGKLEITEIVLRTNLLRGQVSAQALQTLTRLQVFDIGNEEGVNAELQNNFPNATGCLTIARCKTGAAKCNTERTGIELCTFQPTAMPTRSPSLRPTTLPTRSPIAPTLPQPTPSPIVPTTLQPTKLPTTSYPTKKPTVALPSSPDDLSATASPTTTNAKPTKRPTLKPTKKLTLAPTKKPTLAPTKKPTSAPTKKPTKKLPTSKPTKRVTSKPSKRVTNRPTKKPTKGNIFNLGATAAKDNYLLSASAAVEVALPLVRGGFQEARGDCGTGGGNEWYVENSKTLLDAPGEYFLDLKNSLLYFIPPTAATTAAALNQMEFELTSQRILIRARRTVNLVLTNVVFEHTYATHMDENTHEVPSGGDWTVTRQGAVVLESVFKAKVTACVFRNLGGNGLFVSNAAQDVEITRNDFQALGSSAVLLVGDPLFANSTAHNRKLHVDNHVDRVLVKENVMSELGLEVKQSSGVFLALAKSVRIERNVVFDCSRAAITFNDGFGGNHTVVENVMFHVVLDTLDHGPINVWDRQQWLEPAGKLPFTVSNNLVYGNEQGPKGIDLDDGVRNWVVTGNVVLEGLIKIKGANLVYEDNLLYPLSWGCYLMTPLNDLVGANNIKLTRNTCIARTYLSLRPYNFNMNNAESALMCQTKNFVASQNVFWGTKETWLGCGKSGAMGLTTWRSSFSQDVDSAFTAFTVPKITLQIAALVDKLKWAWE
ncbi:hypothetical protein BASA81_012499 [Batrachochytrium salamandrivorans]|nr:hypothetical protein BASA81_012499 [Batrachochytrium salamandrivorans]